MTSDKKEFSTREPPSAPIYPIQATAPQPVTQASSESAPVNSIQQQQYQPPPPPYYEPLPQLRPNQLQPSQNVYNFSGGTVSVGSSPTRLRCPNCSADILTLTSHKSGCLSWAICGSICAIGLFAPCAWLGCQFIPFCIDSCKDVVHNCPNCKVYIGTFDRMK